MKKTISCLFAFLLSMSIIMTGSASAADEKTMVFKLANVNPKDSPVGKGAEKFDHNTIKKHEQLPLKLGMLNPVYFLMY